MNRSSIPNLITLFRIFLAIPLVLVLLEGHYTWALVLLTVAGLSDGVDGYLARRYNWISRLGGILDPISDKTLLVSSFVTLGVVGMLPLWLVVVVILRDIVIVTGAIAYHFVIGRVEMEPTFISKTNTLFQIVLVLAVVLSRSIFELPQYLIDSLIYVVAFTTLYSGVNYVWIWGRRAAANSARP